MKKSIFIFSAIFAVFASRISAKEISVQVTPALQWKQRAPQLAVWIESADGEFVGTIFVTKSASKKSWKFAPKEGRPDSLPAWYSASGTKNAMLKELEADAVTSATPKSAVRAMANFSLLDGQEYFIKAEVNQSFDYNETWTKKNSGVNGQPSVVYAKKFVATDSAQEFSLEIFGTGSPDGGDGKIHFEELKNITTAKEIIGDIFVIVK